MKDCIFFDRSGFRQAAHIFASCSREFVVSCRAYLVMSRRASVFRLYSRVVADVSPWYAID